SVRTSSLDPPFLLITAAAPGRRATGRRLSNRTRGPLRHRVALTAPIHVIIDRFGAGWDTVRPNYPWPPLANGQETRGANASWTSQSNRAGSAPSASA